MYARRTEIHLFEMFGGHLGRHFGKYASVVFVFYIFDVAVLAAILAAILKNIQRMILESIQLSLPTESNSEKDSL